MPQIDESQNAVDTLLYLNRELFSMIEETVSLELLARLFSSQLITHGEKHLMDHSRSYYKVLRSVIMKGQAKGEIRDDMSVNELSKIYTLCEWGMMYDWCICDGSYSIRQYAAGVMPMFLESFRKK